MLRRGNVVAILDRLIMIDRENHLLNSKMIGIRNSAFKENKLRSKSHKLKTLN